MPRRCSTGPATHRSRSGSATDCHSSRRSHPGSGSDSHSGRLLCALDRSLDLAEGLEARHDLEPAGSLDPDHRCRAHADLATLRGLGFHLRTHGRIGDAGRELVEVEPGESGQPLQVVVRERALVLALLRGEQEVVEVPEGALLPAQRAATAALNDSSPRKAKSRKVMRTRPSAA